MVSVRMCWENTCEASPAQHCHPSHFVLSRRRTPSCRRSLSFLHVGMSAATPRLISLVSTSATLAVLSLSCARRGLPFLSRARQKYICGPSRVFSFPCMCDDGMGRAWKRRKLVFVVLASPQLLFVYTTLDTVCRKMGVQCRNCAMKRACQPRATFTPQPLFSFFFECSLHVYPR